MICKRGKLFNICIIAALLVLPVLIGSQVALADTAELEGVKHEIKARGAKWNADETSVSRLSAQEKKMRLGMKGTGELEAIFGDTSEPAPVAAVTGVPAIDWRDVDGKSFVSTIKNQGSCGSCWAFAVTAALESQVMIGTGGTQVDLSEQILVSCSGAGSCSGGYVGSSSDYIRNVGLPDESCFRYTATNNSCSNACANWQASTYSVKGWHTASTSSTPAVRVEDIKNALYTYGPVLATFKVYNDFYYYTFGVYSYTSGSYVGGHAVLIVGYDDVNQAFIVKNSWGTGWGETGYFRIAYSEVGGMTGFGSSAIAYDGYGDAPPPPPPVCTYSLSPTGKTFKPAGGTGSFTVSTGSGCPWTATNTADWVNIVYVSTGEASGQLTYSVAANAGAARTAKITVQGKEYTITQQAQKIRGR